MGLVAQLPMRCDRRGATSGQLLPLFRVDVRLTENASQRADGHFRLSRHDGGIDCGTESANKLDVAAFLADFDEPGGFKATLDFTKRKRIKPPQLRPR